ncbi:MAG TPA: bifunctional 4-hydroxy-2-oxoglutarate aldolase/2-dehydro-3-deoxy-phosphogluconate aldolase [Gaiellaceae bacterium]
MKGRVVPVLTADNADDAVRACEAILAGGLSSVEITFRTDAAVEAIRRASQLDGLIVGAGTVLSESQLAAAVDAGAQFAVAPSTNEAVVRAAHQFGIEVVPGAATPTEIDRARALGCHVVKIFPASTLGGPAFIKAVAAVFPDVEFVPTGGVNPENLGDYLALPSVLACGGTWICEPALLRDGRFDEVERRARETASVLAA